MIMLRLLNNNYLNVSQIGLALRTILKRIACY
jgi:hypothetical protein